MTSPLTSELTAALVARLTAMADDELVLGHRDAEWTGHAPLLEEDIALANLAQDEIGHALAWYEARAALDGSDPDTLVYRRDAGQFRNARLVELPRGDWAFTMLRQFVFDAYEAALLPGLERSVHPGVAAAAAKIRREELFHLRHSALWVERLGRGTEVSAARLRAAAEALAPFVPPLFAPLPGDAALVEAGVLPDPIDVRDRAMARIAEGLERAGLELPEAVPVPGGRASHGEDLVTLLLELQSVARADPEGAAW